jgi:hypothetical protein
MGCGCKDDSLNKLVNHEDTGDLNITGKLLRIPTGILLTLIYVVISPFLLVYIWWLAMKYVFGNKAILFSFLKKFQKERYERPDMDDEDFNEDNYELMDVDIVK